MVDLFPLIFELLLSHMCNLVSTSVPVTRTDGINYLYQDCKLTLTLTLTVRTVT